MNRQDAEKTVTEYLKSIFGFALKRCKTLEDAEDLSQEIALKVFRALIKRDDINDVSKFIWTVAHNALSNYYRDSVKNSIGISIDEVYDLTSDEESELLREDNSEAISRLQKEIAYLSKLQRKIVISYYFENKKQSDIAKELTIPLGTVKWHLFEAKKELKRGIDKMRKSSELKFNPVKFNSIGLNGNAGTKSLNDIFRSALVQNICYCVKDGAKSINEIADALGVSPVYVETEVEFLEEYGLLKEEKEKYISNFIISEPSAELLTVQDKMYKEVADIFANELYDTLMSSGILDDERIICNQTDGPLSLTKSAPRDKNFLMWSLIPYIAAVSGENFMDSDIKFEDVATARPDGGYNIIHASVLENNIQLPSDYVYMNNWCGPMWNGNDSDIFWQVDSRWSDRISPSERNISQESKKVIFLYNTECDIGQLSKHDYAYLIEKGYIKTCGDYDGDFKSSWQIVVLENREIWEELLSVGENIKKKHKEKFDSLKAQYVKASLEIIPPHLRKIRKYELQFIFNSDGWFLLHCIESLLRSGKLKEPTDAQRKALGTLLIKKTDF